MKYLSLAPGAVVLDGTVGGGGHAESILERTAPNGILIGLDVDQDALNASRRRLKVHGDRVHLIQTSFRKLDRALDEVGIHRLDAVLLDLGVSSHQLDSGQRGFRFSESESEATPLDMRMNPEQGQTAADLLNRASATELQGWFQNYGELPGSRRLAKAITESRESSPLKTNADLLRLIREAGIGRGRHHHPATLVFQALRIAVNDELGALEEGLEAARTRLKPGGRLVVLSYHSLEDRIVKHTFRRAAKGCVCPPKQPICTCGKMPSLRVLTRRPETPDALEIESNPRARSVRLRVAESIEEVRPS
ncbi:MAG: 16S rRNA (cytosine(1402)-N(4))-methyltransferase [Deltaproteobacteria bacterium]|nr:16S rRNA (cytosine(1402)-N(4))-methyltransferase [Deltaproteobacteria bacterium]